MAFSGDLGSGIPGLASLIRLIGILSFKDLSEAKKTESKKNLIRPDKNDRPMDPQEGDIPKSNPDHLPRIIREKSLIDSVSGNKGFKPRRVNVHKMMLRGASEYMGAVELYKEALKGQATPEEIDWISGQLELSRKSMYKISPGKKESVPELFKLTQLEDPISGETRYLQTWVIEHTSPKPSPEDLKSLSNLFIKYYSNTSYLSFLDQIKPWFIESY